MEKIDDAGERHWFFYRLIFDWENEKEGVGVRVDRESDCEGKNKDMK